MRSIARLFSHPSAKPLSLAVVVLSIGGLLLLKSPSSTGFRSLGTAHASNTILAGPTVEVDGVRGVIAKLSLSQGDLQAGATRKIFAEIDLSVERAEASRAPVAVAVAVDVSGSMSGAKIESAKSSIRTMIERMSDDDQIAIVAFSSEATTLQPLARLGDVRKTLLHTVSALRAGGGTNIASALQQSYTSLTGAAQGKVRRVVLLSDGQDGSGISLERVGTHVRAKADEGVTLSSIGFGNDFDERYMTTIADVGRGNYAFLQTGSELDGFLTKELSEARQTVMEGAVAEVTLPAGWKAVRAYGVESQADSGKVIVPVGALFGGDRRKVVIEIDADPKAVGTTQSIEGRLVFRTTRDERPRSVSIGKVAVTTVEPEKDVSASIDGEVQAHAVSVVAAAKQRDAVDAWRQGNVAEAQRITDQNVQLLNEQQRIVRDKSALEAQANEYTRDRDTFAKIQAQSESGRAYGLKSNESNWARSKR